MTRFLFKTKKEIGLSPDALYFRGQKKIDNVVLRVIDYNPDSLEETTINSVSDVFVYREKESVTWFNVDGLHDESIMHEIANGFGFDDLIMAEVMDTQARPRIQEHNHCLLISIKMLQQDETEGTIEVENLSLLLTPGVLLSFQEKSGDVFEPVRGRIRAKKKRIRNSGVDYLAFALLDVVVDNYIYMIGLFGEKIENLEDKLNHDPDHSIIEEINSYKQELNVIRKSIHPSKEMILALSKLDSEYIKETSHVHYKELLDNINHATELTDNYREILSDQLNIYHTAISTKLNDIMKFLTVFSVIFIPLTFIAGIYGTNFDFVPELHYKYSYYIMWGVIIMLAVGMLLYFKRKKWL